MPRQKHRAERGDLEETRATARLPGLDIDIVHRRLPGGEAEQLAITLQAMPSFESLGRLLVLANPFVFWSEVARLVWSTRTDATQALPPSAPSVPALPKPRGGSGADTRS